MQPVCIMCNFATTADLTQYGETANETAFEKNQLIAFQGKMIYDLIIYFKFFISQAAIASVHFALSVNYLNFSLLTQE